MFARERHKATFPLYRAFEWPKARQKSFKRIFHPLKKHLPRARVSRASHAWQVRAAQGKAKVGGFTALRNYILPRVRTQYTKKPSRFVHALPARPLKKRWAGVGGVRALTEWSIYFLLCLLAILGLLLVGVGVTPSRRRRHTCFAYVSILISAFSFW